MQTLGQLFANFKTGKKIEAVNCFHSSAQHAFDRLLTLIITTSEMLWWAERLSICLIRCISENVCMNMGKCGLQAATNPWGGQQRTDSFATGTAKASTLLADADWLPALFPLFQCAADLRHWFNHSCFAASHCTWSFSPFLPLMLINFSTPLVHVLRSTGMHTEYVQYVFSVQVRPPSWLRQEYQPGKGCQTPWLDQMNYCKKSK